MKYLLYQISFDQSCDELNNSYSDIPEHEKEKIHNMDVLASFDYEDKSNKYNCYLLTTKIEIEIYKNILNNNIITYICKDISQDVISNNIDIEKIISSNMDKKYYILLGINYEIFIAEITEWIYQNMDLDFILDRINKDGIESLRPIDRYFLLHYNEKN